MEGGGGVRESGLSLGVIFCRWVSALVWKPAPCRWRPMLIRWCLACLRYNPTHHHHHRAPSAGCTAVNIDTDPSVLGDQADAPDGSPVPVHVKFSGIPGTPDAPLESVLAVGPFFFFVPNGWFQCRLVPCRYIRVIRHGQCAWVGSEDAQGPAQV
jgi:hypothetical protein